MASPTQWTWVWVNSRSWWWTGRPGVLQSMGSQSQTQLSNWTGTYFDIHPKFLYLIHKTIPSSVSTCDASLKWAFSRPNAARCTPGQTSEAQQTWLALNRHWPLLCLLASHKPSHGWLQTQQTEFSFFAILKKEKEEKMVTSSSSATHRFLRFLKIHSQQAPVHLWEASAEPSPFFLWPSHWAGNFKGKSPYCPQHCPFEWGLPFLITVHTGALLFVLSTFWTSPFEN